MERELNHRVIVVKDADALHGVSFSTSTESSLSLMESKGLPPDKSMRFQKLKSDEMLSVIRIRKSF